VTNPETPAAHDAGKVRSAAVVRSAAEPLER